MGGRSLIVFPTSVHFPSSLGSHLTCGSVRPSPEGNDRREWDEGEGKNRGKQGETQQRKVSSVLACSLLFHLHLTRSVTERSVAKGGGETERVRGERGTQGTESLWTEPIYDVRAGSVLFPVSLPSRPHSTRPAGLVPSETGTVRGTEWAPNRTRLQTEREVIHGLRFHPFIVTTSGSPATTV